ncbi:suppressor of fused domain protein [Chitinophaga nivalis]|uniref:Suppressor of fused domain protein n=1 Tax=Chitinophaga nivalis TaxID=2991709 RepID=A0ABT3IJ85_9BACT|nr:suppressor of fused domain protein [Chitinophaga nivalis]MCW3466287.1 suppressor of fused domain protein [Chitinophaga nivalis]MCW3484022.1 suppressor of fused domain protein [Chitinophaga nivalis]
MDLATYQSLYKDNDATPGWTAIDEQLQKIYGTTEPLVHWATAHKYMLGGPDPLDGVSVYAATAGDVPHWHFVTYGFTSLYYDEESIETPFSGSGFELTFRLKPRAGWTVDADSTWVVGLLQNIARYIFSSNKWFEPFHWMPANGPIKLEDDTLVHGLIFIEDPEMPLINTPHGTVQFLQMVGITAHETELIKEKKVTAAEVVARLQQTSPYLLCDLDRKTSVV